MRQLAVLAAFALVLPGVAGAQAGPTASRAADIQIGGGYTVANSDYTINHIRGFAFYSDLDVTEHFGAALAFHQLNDPEPTKVYERTYEVGGRYVRRSALADVFGKGLYGRGVFNFPQDSGNLAYNLVAGAAGVDLHISRHVNVRLEYEYQRWLSGPGLGSGLSPQMVTVGVAYRIPGGGLGHRRR